VRAFGANEPGRLRLLQSAVRVAQHDRDRVRVGGGHVLRQLDQFDAALDPDPLLFDRRAQEAFSHQTAASVFFLPALNRS